MAPEAPIDRLQRPLRDLRISVTDRCNLRCPYCMPAEVFSDKHSFLAKDQLLTFEEIARVARAFARLGGKKIRLTGGEPLLRRDLPALVSQIAQVEGIDDIALTTNGIHLPQQAADLAHAGLRRATISLDSLDEEVFRRLAGRDSSPALVLDGVRAAQDAGLAPIKINCVVIEGINDHTVVDLAAHFRGSGHVVRFIEFMDVGTLNDWSRKRVVPSAEIIRRIAETFPLEPVESSYRGEVARRYRYLDGAGEIGVISSVSAPFCGDCTRVRLTSDGRILTCLFASDGPSLREDLRSGASEEALADRLSSIWSLRSDRYSELRAARGDADAQRIEMYQVGG